jgi:hypothetical protein
MTGAAQVFFPAHVAFMSRGVAGRFWKCPENNENKSQHVRHEKGPS